MRHTPRGTPREATDSAMSTYAVERTAMTEDGYEWAIPAADTLYDGFLHELRKEGLI